MKNRLFVAFSLTLVLVLAALPAQARLVQVTWDASVESAEGEPELPESFADQHVFMRQKGFVLGVVREAQAMLPAELSEARLGLLEEYLTPLANAFVRSYSEVGLTRTENGGSLMLDVVVDAQALKDRLRRLGLFATAAEPMDYVLSMGELPVLDEKQNADPEKRTPWEQVGRLQALSGLRAVQDAAMADAALTLQFDGKMWSGRLATPHADYAGVNEHLDVLWVEIWGQFFLQPGLGETVTDGVVLEVDGCYTPDCVEAFDRLMNGWRTDVESAQFMDMTMRSTGITARWRLKVLSKEGLEARLHAFMPPRKLTWAFFEEQETASP